MNRVRYMCLLYFINEFAIRKYCTIPRGEVRLQGVVLCQIAEFCTKARQLRLARAHRKYWHHITLQNHEMLQFYQSKEIILDLECRGITFPMFHYLLYAFLSVYKMEIKVFVWEYLHSLVLYEPHFSPKWRYDLSA